MHKLWSSILWLPEEGLTACDAEEYVQHKIDCEKISLALTLLGTSVLDSDCSACAPFPFELAPFEEIPFEEAPFDGTAPFVPLDAPFWFSACLLDRSATSFTHGSARISFTLSLRDQHTVSALECSTSDKAPTNSMNNVNLPL